MTDDQLLTALFKKAKKNGWKKPALGYDQDDTMGIIFNHDFAKALWGEKEAVIETFYRNDKGQVVLNQSMKTYTPNYLWHLGMMARSQDRLKYLREWGDNQQQIREAITAGVLDVDASDKTHD